MDSQQAYNEMDALIGQQVKVTAWLEELENHDEMSFEIDGTMYKYEDGQKMHYVSSAFADIDVPAAIVKSITKTENGTVIKLEGYFHAS